VTNDLDFSPADRKAELLRWLSEEGRFAPDTGGLLEMLCGKLTVLGAPIARATVHVRTLHPEFRGISRIWRRGHSTEFRTSRHGIEYTSDYQNSPFNTLSKPDSGLILSLAKPPIGASRFSQRCGRKALPIT
jgi:adenylate cyclase